MATKKASASPSSTGIKKSAPKKADTSKSVEKAKVTARKKRTPGKTSTKLAPSFSLEPRKTKADPAISHDEISLRAYFIAERRRQMGWDGDSHTDWLEAVAQLRAEALEKPLKKR
jgi:hypothetical protein